MLILRFCRFELGVALACTSRQRAQLRRSRFMGASHFDGVVFIYCMISGTARFCDDAHLAKSVSARVVRNASLHEPLTRHFCSQNKSTASLRFSGFRWYWCKIQVV